MKDNAPVPLTRSWKNSTHLPPMSRECGKRTLRYGKKEKERKKKKRRGSII